MVTAATPCVLACTAYFVLCTVYLLVGVNRRKQWQKAILKCSPLILLLIFSWSYGSSSDRGNVEHSNNHWLLLLGLIFSCVGDGLLVFRTHLGLFGIISFAIAQLIYIGLFGLSVDRVVEQSMYGLLSGILVLILSFSIVLLFGWRFSSILKTGDHGMRRRFIALVMPMAILYFVLISLMLWSAILQLQHRFDLIGCLGATGGFLFYVSDVLIAAGAIWQFKVLLHGRILVMVTYYGAQLLITLSVLME